MNVKPGDLAIVVRAEATPQFVGRIFKITGPCPVYEGFWDTEPPVYVEGFRQPLSFIDRSLRRIDGQPGNEEWFRQAPSPTKTLETA